MVAVDNCSRIEMKLVRVRGGWGELPMGVTVLRGEPYKDCSLATLFSLFY